MEGGGGGDGAREGAGHEERERERNLPMISPSLYSASPFGGYLHLRIVKRYISSTHSQSNLCSDNASQ